MEYAHDQRNIVLIHPSTLRALDVQPRQPVVVFYPSGAVSTALLWPSSQVLDGLIGFENFEFPWEFNLNKYVTIGFWRSLDCLELATIFC